MHRILAEFRMKLGTESYRKNTTSDKVKMFVALECRFDHGSER